MSAAGADTGRTALLDACTLIPIRTRTVPMFANLAADAAAHPLGPASPFPALVGADEDEAVAALGEPGDLTNPAQVAFAW